MPDHNLKSSAAAGASPAPATFGPTWETIVVIQVSVLIVGASWAFGGQVGWARTAIHFWGLAGIGLFLAACVRRAVRRPRERFTPLCDLWPLLAFDVLVGFSCLNSSFHTFVREGESFFELVAPRWPSLPSSARPDLSATALLLWNGIILSAYNLCLVVRRRRLLRRLLVVIVANAVLLAILGTLAKLSRADGLWFGAVPSPQNYFFSTFVYHNHWSAFTLLNLGACLGLLFHADRQSDRQEGRHSRVPVMIVGALLLAATLPLSGSRSGTGLGALLLGGAVVHFLARQVRRRRATGTSTAAPTAGIALGVVLALAAVGYLARDVIRQRAALTVSQVSAIRAEDTLNSRLAVYRDTWRMAGARPWFGWGLDSYGDVFRIFNSQRSVEGWMPYYREAHNDWLQFLAETGGVGLTLLLLTGAVPLARARWRDSRSPIPRYLLASAGLILLYGTFEFPLANPSVLIGFWTSLFLARAYLESASRTESA